MLRRLIGLTLEHFEVQDINYHLTIMDTSEWKKPSDVMKIHRRRKSVSQKRITADADKRTSVIYKSPSKSQKRKNPFYKDSPHPFPAKRQQIEFKENDSGVQDPLSCQLFNILDSANEEKSGAGSQLDTKTAEVLREKQYSDVQNHRATKQDTSKPTDDKASSGKEESGNAVSAYLPVDWSLKTKLRVVSSRPLDWCIQLKSADEANGVADFVSHQPSKCDIETARKRRFHSNCMYWIHPSIPWMKLFPRIIEDSKSSLSVSYLLQEEVQKSLQADWEHSFTSAYHQLRSGLSPYFYVCTHQFTVLFYNRCGTQTGVIAMVTPTTRGFRESLENEGIEFKLPVGNKLTSPSRRDDVDKPATDATEGDKEETLDKASDKTEVDDYDILETDDAAHTWLESMGLDKKQFPSLDPKKVKLQREGFRVIDHRPESLVLVEGSDVQAFFNFLLNCRTCVAMSGTQGGLPPTILSPKPFKGATLKCHKVKHTAVKQSDKEGNVTQAHIVEVTGPILPNHSQSLVNLLHSTQKADFGMVFNTHDSTVPFNVLSKLVKNVGPQWNSTSLSENLAKTCDSTELNASNSSSGTTPSSKFSSSKSRVSPRGIDTSLNDSRCNVSTILETIDEEDVLENETVEEKCDMANEKMPTIVEGFHRLMPIEGDRICALKEVVCTPEGFTWTT